MLYFTDNSIWGISIYKHVNKLICITTRPHIQHLSANNHRVTLHLKNILNPEGYLSAWALLLITCNYNMRISKVGRWLQITGKAFIVSNTEEAKEGRYTWDAVSFNLEPFDKFIASSESAMTLKNWHRVSQLNVSHFCMPGCSVRSE